MAYCRCISLSLSTSSWKVGRDLGSLQPEKGTISTLVLFTSTFNCNETQIMKNKPVPAAFNYSNPLWIDIFGNIESLIHETNSSNHLQKSYTETWTFFWHQFNMVGMEVAINLLKRKCKIPALSWGYPREFFQWQVPIVSPHSCICQPYIYI